MDRLSRLVGPEPYGLGALIVISVMTWIAWRIWALIAIPSIITWHTGYYVDCKTYVLCIGAEELLQRGRDVGNRSIEVVAFKATLEEVFFRVAPMIVAIRAGNPLLLVAVGISSSIIFGFSHTPHTMCRIITSASFGMFMTYLFLKAGALRESYIQAALCISIVHTVHNLMVYNRMMPF